MGHFEQVLGKWGRRPQSTYGLLATTLPLDVFTQRNFAADFFRQKLTFTGKNSEIAFCATLWGT